MYIYIGIHICPEISRFSELGNPLQLGILFAVTRPLRLGEDVKAKPGPEGPEFTVHSSSPWDIMGDIMGVKP